MNKYTTHQITGIHKLPLFGALGVVILTIVLVLGSVIGGVEPVGSQEADKVAERDLYFKDQKNGEVSVFDAQTKEQIGNFKKGQGAFVRISMRSMMRQRILKEIDLGKPFKLVQFSDGNLKITDPFSDGEIRVNAFGPVAIESFNQFLSINHLEKGAIE